MSAAENKRLVREIFEALAQGDGKPFVDAWADDFTWIIEGQSKWSLRYEGKEAVLAELMRPLFANFATRYRNAAEEIIAEDERVVVLCRGEVRTKSGKDYNNSYCYVIRMRDGMMAELREYMDTALAEAVLERPANE